MQIELKTSYSTCNTVWILPVFCTMVAHSFLTVALNWLDLLENFHSLSRTLSRRATEDAENCESLVKFFASHRVTEISQSMTEFNICCVPGQKVFLASQKHLFNSAPVLLTQFQEAEDGGNFVS